MKRIGIIILCLLSIGIVNAEAFQTGYLIDKQTGIQEIWRNYYEERVWTVPKYPIHWQPPPKASCVIVKDYNYGDHNLRIYYQGYQTWLHGKYWQCVIPNNRRHGSNKIQAKESAKEEPIIPPEPPIEPGKRPRTVLYKNI